MIIIMEKSSPENTWGATDKQCQTVDSMVVEEIQNLYPDATIIWQDSCQTDILGLNSEEERKRIKELIERIPIQILNTDKWR